MTRKTIKAQREVKNLKIAVFSVVSIFSCAAVSIAYAVANPNSAVSVALVKLLQASPFAV